MAGHGKDQDFLALAAGSGKPPQGAQRPVQECGDIGLAIARDGTWSYQGSPIGRIALVKLFASVLKREADGRYYLITPVEKVSIAVEDAPFLAVAMETEGSGEGQVLRFRTNLDETVSAGPGHPLRFRPEASGSFTPFVEIRGGLEARLVRAVYYDLVGLAVEKEGRLGVFSGGAFFPFPAPQ